MLDLKELAKAAGMKHYLAPFQLCIHHRDAHRYTSSGSCVECEREKKAKQRGRTNAPTGPFSADPIPDTKEGRRYREMLETHRALHERHGGERVEWLFLAPLTSKEREFLRTVFYSWCKLFHIALMGRDFIEIIERHEGVT